MMQQQALKPYVNDVMQFLNEIGIPTSVVSGASGFLDSVRVSNGCIEIDTSCTASDLLHEAGHLATVPGAFRHLMSGDLEAGIKRMFEEIDRLNLEPDHPLSRAAMQSGEAESTAWAWAAGEHLSIPPELIIEDRDYSGDGSDMRAMLMAKAYLGINGLMHGGFCVIRPSRYRNLPVYPQLAFWLQK